jgi:O-antigen/teichoic acid export membrane protein
MHRQIMRFAVPKGLIHVLANLGGTFWSAAIGIAFVPLYVARLGIESYGLIGFIAALQVWFSLLDMGFTTTLNREMAQISSKSNQAKQVRDLLRTLEFLVVTIAFLIIIALIILGGSIARTWLKVEYLSVDEVEDVMSIAGIIIALRWISALYSGALQGLQDQVWLNGARIIFSTFRALGSVMVLYFVSNTVLSFFIFQCLTFFIESLFFVLRVYGKIPGDGSRGKFSLTSLNSVWKYSASVAFFSLLGTILAHSDKVLLSKLVSLSEFGVYSLAALVAGVITMAASSVYSAAFPRFASHCQDQMEVLKEFSFMSQLSSILIIPASLTILFFSDSFMQFFLHKQGLSENEGFLLSVLVAGMMLNSLMYLPVALLLASGKTRKLVVINVISIIFFLPGVLYFVPVYGVIAAAWIWFGLNLGYITFGAFYIFIEFPKLKIVNWYLFDLMVPILISVSVLFSLKAIFSEVHNLIFIGLAFVITTTMCFLTLGQLRLHLFKLQKLL